MSLGQWLGQFQHFIIQNVTVTFSIQLCAKLFYIQTQNLEAPSLLLEQLNEIIGQLTTHTHNNHSMLPHFIQQYVDFAEWEPGFSFLEASDTVLVEV